MIAATPAPGWTPEAIEALLTRQPRAVERAIVALYQRQTAAERAEGVTAERNGVGFDGSDAYTFSFVAERLAEGTHLRAETLERYLPRVLKYCNQLAQIANEALGIEAA